MNRLFAKITGRAVKNWQTFLKSVEEDVTSLAQAGSLANDYAAEILAARAAFVATPSTDTCRRWIETKGLELAACGVAAELQELFGSRRQELLSSPEARGKLRDALLEVHGALVAKKEAVIAADKVRAEETGVEEKSTNTIMTIEREIARIEEGLAWSDADPSRGVSALSTVLS